LKLSDHFTLEEAVASQEATRRGIDNDPSVAMLPNMRAQAAMMERIRAFLMASTGREVPIIITSWFRCLQLNRALGSDDTSAHVTGDACDWRAPSMGSPTEICRMLAPAVNELGIGQLINEYPDRAGWIHTSRLPVARPVNRIITIKGAGTFAGILQ
jgi:hypothetical protein